MIDEYINNKKYKDEKNTLKEEIYFGQILGFIIIILSTFNFFNTTNLMVSNLMIYTIILGVSLVIVGLIFPYFLYYPSKVLKYITNKIFYFIFLVILFVLYILLVLPVGMFTQKKLRIKYGFYKWNDKAIENMVGFKKSDIKYIDYSKNKKNKLKNVIEIIMYFVTSKQYLFLPLLFLLIIIGLLFFFVTSSVVAPMIYTLF